MDTRTEWYYALGGERRGPVGLEQLRALHAAGTIDRTTLVWAAPMTDWQPLSQSVLAAEFERPSGLPPSSAQGAAAWPAQAQPAAGSGPSFGEAVRLFLQKYAVFSGRANRPEFWYAVLFMVLLSIAAAVLDALTVGLEASVQPFGIVTSLAVLIPSISVGVRRLHDTDRSGWWYLLSFVPLVGWIILIVFWCQRGTEGPNRFG